MFQQTNGKQLKKVFCIYFTNTCLLHFSGQRIPSGLHVRLNLQTGLREAKLLDDNEQQSSSNTIIPVSLSEHSFHLLSIKIFGFSDTTEEEISRQNLEQAFAKLDLSKDDVQTNKVLYIQIHWNSLIPIFLFRLTKMRYVKNIVHMKN